ncbi:MAG TPA: flagellar biosynthetic protein FliO [Planctomycetota bacterium]|nr:flagellar biosynthetic protein FliO [Planctomycetota bacterium]
MGAPHQDPSVPAAQASVEIPAELLKNESPATSPRLEALKKIEDQKIGQSSTPEPGIGGALGATVFVVALLLGAFLVLKKFLGRSRLFASGTAMRILARRPLAPRQEVILVEIGSRVLIVGATRESLSRLGEVTAADEIASLRARVGAAPVEAAPARSLPAPVESKPAPSYDGVIEELSRIRTTVNDWSRQEVTP